MERDDILKVYEAGPEAVITLIQGLMDVHQRQINELTATIVKLQARIEELEFQTKKNSHNSNKPPSSDGMRKERGKKPRRKSRRRPGGQKGHEGHQLRITGSPDHIQVHDIKKCRNCCGTLSGTKTIGIERRQVFDLPDVKLEVTEHQAATKECPFCGSINKAEFPDGVTRPTQYGKRIKGMAVYLNQYQLLPYERLVAFMNDIFGLTISKGTLYNFNKQGYEILKPVEEKTKELLKRSLIIHSDETGISCDKTLQWLHVASTARLTFYLVHAKRGKDAMDDMGILPDYEGRVIHDFWKPYFRYDINHGMCNAHSIRELTFIYEEYKQKWASDMIGLLLRIKKKVDCCTKRLHASTIQSFEKEYELIIRKGLLKNPRSPGEKHRRGRKKQTKARNLLNRLNEYKNEVLAFMFDVSVPFDNNQAERDLRMVKVQQKISGCFRSEEGAGNFCRIRGYISTVRKNGINVFDALQGIFDGKPFYPKFAE
jgi:transposase